jgi:hypothetical protein
MKINLKKLHAQKKSWQQHGRLSLCWIFYCVNDDAKIDFENTQIMHCIICYQEPIIGINSKTQARKRLIFYYKTNGITSLKKHVDAEHIVIAKLFEEEINFLLKRREEKQPAKKRAIVFSGSIIFFNLSKIP